MKKFAVLGLFLGFFAVAGDPIVNLQNNNAVTNIATSGYTQIAGPGTLFSEVEFVDVFNSSTSGTLILGVGRAGGEVEALLIPPSTARTFPVRIGKGARLALKAKNSAVSAGEIILNFFAR